MVLQILLLVGLVLFSVLAILVKDLLKAAISLAVASLLLGIIFFRMNAPYAGVFEISVVAGLITVLFMLTIALTKGGDAVESKAASFAFPAFFVVFIVIDALIMKKLIQKVPALPGPEEAGTFGQVLWNARTLDLVGQIAVIFAGVFAVLALFRKGDNKDE
jgi:NADH:ubiquinone oxidoreductase subunit 6 (subunit J)